LSREKPLKSWKVDCPFFQWQSQIMVKGIQIATIPTGTEHLLTPAAQKFLATLQRTFNARRLSLLQAR
jgi:hypothetical protein